MATFFQLFTVSAVLSFSVSAAIADALAPASSLLFQNNGNWTEHEATPSTVLLHDPVSLVDADAACQVIGERLLACSDLPAFEDQLAYHVFIGTIPNVHAVWTSCDTTSSAARVRLPPLCANTAPFTAGVFADFSTYPRVRVSSSGTTFTGVRDHMSFRFMGVPYAAAPVGELRFAYTRPFEGGEVDATVCARARFVLLAVVVGLMAVVKPACLQFGSFEGNASGLNPWGNSEDCLYLNVFTPFIPGPTPAPASALKPVMLWIHGGDNINGAGSDATFDGGSLSSRSDVVVVTINYRLNVFGYLALNDSLVPGSYALADKIQALTWVRAHIAAFGGDAARVTVLGQSAGGWSVVDLIKAPRARGLFARAVIHSGGAGNIVQPAVAAAQVLPTITQLCPQSSPAARLACLRALPAETLLNVTLTLGNWPTVVDGVFCTDTTLAQIALGPGKEGSVNAVEVMAGFMPDEGQSLMGTAISPNETSFDHALDTLVASGSIDQALATAVAASGLWNVTPEFTPYNASQSILTDSFLTCDGTAFVSAAANAGVFPSIHVYSMKRAYGLTFFDPFGLCTFPVGAPASTPYFRCHSGDLYALFGTYYLFGQPIRVPDDIGFTNLVQDAWAAFARAGDPNPDPRYLAARGAAYAGSRAVFEAFRWPVFDARDGARTVAALQFLRPEPLEGLPDPDRCEVVLATNPLA